MLVAGARNPTLWLGRQEDDAPVETSEGEVSNGKRMWGTSGVPVGGRKADIARPLGSWRLVEAFLVGALAAATLVVGGLIVFIHKPAERTLGLVMAFGAGVLVSAVAFELVEEATEMAEGAGPAFVGSLRWGDHLHPRRCSVDPIQGSVIARTSVAPRLTHPARRSSSVRCSTVSRNRQCSGSPSSKRETSRCRCW